MSGPPLVLSADEVRALVGVPETTLPADVAAQLPDATPGAPWQVRMSALLWRHRANAESAGVVPAPLAAKAKGVISAGFVRYDETPVGPYSEVMGAVAVSGGLLPRVHIPFIAVDSVASVHGGRTHWALPKVLANFTWQGPDDVRADGDGWAMAARVVGTGPRIPMFGRSTNVQVRPDGYVGTSSTGIRGWGRVVTFDVDVAPSASFASWLVSGRHRGVLVTGARLSMSKPRWVAR